MWNNGDSQALLVIVALILVFLLVVWHGHRMFCFVMAKFRRPSTRET